LLKKRVDGDEEIPRRGEGLALFVLTILRGSGNTLMASAVIAGSVFKTCKPDEAEAAAVIWGR
jgi:hypothetical protein